MSVADLKRTINEHILKVLKKDLRPYLDAAVHEIEINETRTITNLQNYTGVAKTRAEQIFADIIDSARAEFYEKKVGDFRQQGKAYKPNVFRFDRPDSLLPPNLPLKSRYAVIDRWKRKKLTPFLVAKWGKRVPEIANFSSDFHLGHGRAEKGGTGLAAVAYRQEESVRQVKAEGGAAAENLIATVLQQTSLLDGIDVHVHTDVWYDPTTKVKKEYVVYLDFQWGAANVERGQKIEKAANQKLQRFFDDLLKDDKRLENWAFYTGASTPYLKYIDKAIDSAVLGKKIKKEKSKAKAKGSLKGKVSRQTIKSPAFRIRPRDAKGQFVSTMGIQAILDAKVKETVADNMGKGGALVYRTGRFAGSVSVEKVMQSRQGTLTAFYTYMKAPYQTFERGFKQGSLRRDPRKLISASIREIARETLSHKLHIRTRRV
jgi:hypothetical protein